jgi:hypothetical protein
MSPNRTLGLLLIAIGSALLLVLTTDVGGELVVLLIGVGFLVAHVATGSYGLLVPGAILAGLGTGILVQSYGGPPETVTMGLGTGFLAIAVVDRVRGSTGAGWWWPLIPGSVLLLTSASTVTGLRDLERYLLPTVLIVVGAFLLVRHGRAPEPPPPASGEPGLDRPHDAERPGSGEDRLATRG